MRRRPPSLEARNRRPALGSARFSALESERPALLGAALLVAAMTTIQLSNALAVGLIGAVGAVGAAALRNGFAGAALIAFARPKVRGLEPSARRLVLLFGGTSALHSASAYVAISRIPLGVALGIAFLGPLGVTIAAARRRRDLLWASLASVGLLFMLDPFAESSLDVVGVAAAGTTAVGWAAYLLLSRRLVKTLPGLEGLALSISCSSLWLVAVALALGIDGTITIAVVGAGIAVGLFSTAVPFAMESLALRMMPIGTVGIFASAEPALAAAVGAFVLGQQVSPRALVGIVLVVVAAAGATRSGRTASTPLAPK